MNDTGQTQDETTTTTRPNGAGEPRLVTENTGLVVDMICKSFKKRPVVRGISLQLQRGQVVGLLGPNGAGKTTCFYMITGLLPVDYGRLTLAGHALPKTPRYRRAMLGLR